MQNQTAHWVTRPLGWAGALTLSLLAIAGCSDNPSAPNGAGDETTTADARGGGPGAQGADQVYEFAPPVFDIAAAPNGNILVAETVFPASGATMSTVKEIRRTGRAGGVRDVVDMTTVPGSPVNGLAMIGARSFFATSGGLDLALGAGVWHVTPGGQRLIGDVEAFETTVDPDANGGLQWKVTACEESPPDFSAGPQSNPYHLEQLGGGTALVADAAGNSVLEVNMNGGMDWVAVFTPPTATGQSSDDPGDWMVLFPLGPEGPNCYVQPVPTSVAIGPDGGYYVGELTGVTPADIGAPGPSTNTGLSRVWRIEPGARNVTCPSGDCTQVLGGFTSVLDVAFGPDGLLYVVEYDEANWFAATTPPASPLGGTINACDVSTGDCSVVEGGLTLPSAITFDKWGNLWLLENNLAVPTVRQVELN